MDLASKTVLITGAKGGLGNSVTTAFLNAGATVVGVARSIANADFPNERFTAVETALESVADATQVVRSVVAKTGRVDALVHLVGGYAGGKPIAETDDATLDNMIELNFRVAFYVLRAVLPQMRTQGSGRIIAIGGKAAVEPVPGAAIYAATKAALVSLVRTAAQENKDHGITVNAILPGTMDTPGNRAAMPKADFSKWVDPAQIASLIVHLASDHASQVNGAVIPVYGSES
jgi:NAD(P)-dependent dehydrogenase (short-subunit alcohol dehydrogenase family)